MGKARLVWTSIQHSIGVGIHQRGSTEQMSWNVTFLIQIMFEWYNSLACNTLLVCKFEVHRLVPYTLLFTGFWLQEPHYCRRRGQVLACNTLLACKFEVHRLVAHLLCYSQVSGFKSRTIVAGVGKWLACFTLKRRRLLQHGCVQECAMCLDCGFSLPWCVV